MSESDAWAWGALFLLGIYHGLNPGMGWLFAVALGMQERSGRAVGKALLPIALGHAIAIGLVVFLALLLPSVIPGKALRFSVAALLIALGLYRLIRQRHPRWVGMRVGFADLTLWSFLMASAHGAGLMLLPILMGASASTAGVEGSHSHEGMATFGDPMSGLAATLVHTGGYLAMTGLAAWVFYEKLGLALLRKAWLNLDLVWAIALIATGALTLVI